MNITNRTLYQLNQQKIELQTQMPYLALLLRPKIKQWDNDNGIRTNTVLKKLDAMEKEYFVHDENGQMKYEGEEGKQQPVLIEGKTREDFDKTANEFLDKEVNIII